MTNHGHAEFRFHATGGGTAFQCTLDGATTACTSPFAADIADGSHSFQVVAQDGDAVDDTPATFAWLVDTVPPDTAIAFGPPADDNSPTEQVVFSGTDGAIAFECALDGEAFTACTSPATITPPDGDHMFQVRAVDAAGNRDPSPASVSWNLNTAAPDTMITAGPADASTTAANVSFSFTSPEITATFECSMDTAAFAACTSPQAATLASGDHTFAVRAKDSHGVIDPSPASRAFHVDTVPPVVTITHDPGNPTNDNTPQFAFSASEPATFECQIDGVVAFTACTSPFTSPQLTDGAHVFRVRPTDTVGNQGAQATFSWTSDTVPPTVAITSGPTGPTATATPSFGFTTGAGAVASQCRVDAATPVTCTSPFVTPPLTDGAHTTMVSAIDAAGNFASATRSFSVDTTAPVVVFDLAPPAKWPVNYFDIQFHTVELATFQCSLNGAAFATCSSPVSVTTSYDVASTFVVRAKDVLGNSIDKTATWTAKQDVVLHYPFEQGSTNNTSLLSQVPALSPDGSIDPIPVVGGWAGTAAASPVQHHYTGTRRALTSSPQGKYAATVWIRPTTAPGGVIWSNASATAGMTVSFAGGKVTLTVLQNGTPFTASASVALGEWHDVGVISDGPGTGVQLWIDGVLRGTAATTTATGFDAAQATDLTVGPLVGIDIDDLVFLNHTSTNLGNLGCALARGQITNGVCVALRPAFELAFEGNFADTGFLHLPGQPPASADLVAGKLGKALHLTGPSDGFGFTGLGPAAVAMPGHSFTFWVTTSAASVDDTLLDFTGECDPGSGQKCGGSVDYDAADNLLVFTFTTSSGASDSVAFPVTFGPHSVVLSEVRASGVTQAVDVYVDGVRKVVTLGSGDLITVGNDSVSFASQAGTILDEIQFWPQQLDFSPGLLCENGLDGMFDPVTDGCVLTSN